MIARLALLGLLLLPVAGALCGEPTAAPLSLERQVTLMARSLGAAAGAALVATLLGVAGAALLACRNLPGRALLTLAAMAPFLVPPYLWALAWLGVTKAPPLPLVLGGCLYPLVLAPTLHAFTRCPAGLVDHARLAGGRPWRTVLLPLAIPYAAAGAALVFLLALGEYGVPSLLGVDTWAVEVFALLGGYHDLPAAARASLPALGLGLAVVALAPRTAPHAASGAALELPARWRHPAAGLLAAALAGLALPLAALARQADRLPLALWQAGPDLLASLGAAALAAVLATAGAAWLAAARRPLPVAALLAFPPALLALGWSTWEMPLAVGLAAHALPLAFPLLLVSYLAVPRSLDEAARLQRHGGLLRFVGLHRPALRLSAALVFAFALGDLTVGLLLTPPGGGTLAARLFQLQHSGQPDLVAALCLVQVALGLSPFLAAAALNALEEP